MRFTIKLPMMENFLILIIKWFFFLCAKRSSSLPFSKNPYQSSKQNIKHRKQSKVKSIFSFVILF